MSFGKPLKFPQGSNIKATLFNEILVKIPLLYSYIYKTLKLVFRDYFIVTWDFGQPQDTFEVLQIDQHSTLRDY